VEIATVDPVADPAPRAAGRGEAVLHVCALAVALILGARTAHEAQWDLVSLLLLIALTTVSDLMSVTTGAATLEVSGSFLGLMVTAVLLGGSPAALIGVLSISVGWLKTREPWHYFLNNLVVYAWFPLLGGLAFHALTQAGNIATGQVGYYLLVFAVFVLALGVNFLMVAAYNWHVTRVPIWQQAREAVIPLLSSELFSALLTLAAVFAAVEVGVGGLALFAIVLVVFQFLAGELLASKQRAEEVHRLATTDDLTGLANRELFRIRLEQEIGRCVEDGDSFGILLIDLDGFKEINDTLGHDYGDVLLQELGPRLADMIDPAGLVARLGGDEFAVLPGNVPGDLKVLEAIAERLLACAQLPFRVNHLALEIGASIGIARYPDDGEDAHTLLRRADIAMYEAKRAQSGIRHYEPVYDDHSIQRLRLLGDVRRAISAGEIVVHYQPIVDLGEMRVHGAEALVRWEHPERGLLAPGTFVPIVEQTGLISPLTRYVLERAVAQCATWREAGTDLCVSVNLSVRNLLDRNLPGEIGRLLRSRRLPPEALQLEITESMIMSDPDRALLTITELSNLGVQLAVDDFGTGYSSLDYLSRLPIDELKIDRSFVSPMLTDPSNLIIVRSTINLAHDLRLAIIAEGVEDAETLAHLDELGCDRVQGFYLGRPMAVDAFDAWMRETRTSAAA
jgi:diguanylate cyclase (GGDEF)-like protein